MRGLAPGRLCCTWSFRVCRSLCPVQLSLPRSGLRSLGCRWGRSVQRWKGAGERRRAWGGSQAERGLLLRGHSGAGRRAGGLGSRSWTSAVVRGRRRGLAYLRACGPAARVLPRQEPRPPGGCRGPSGAARQRTSSLGLVLRQPGGSFTMFTRARNPSGRSGLMGENICKSQGCS